MSRKSPKKCKIYKYNYTCNRLPKKNLLKKSSEIEFSSGDILTSKKSRFQRILNRVRGKKKREISPSYFITPWYNVVYVKTLFYFPVEWFSHEANGTKQLKRDQHHSTYKRTMQIERQCRKYRSHKRTNEPKRSKVKRRESRKEEVNGTISKEIRKTNQRIYDQSRRNFL